MLQNKVRYINATPVEECCENRARSAAGTWSGPAYAAALETLRAAPTAKVVPLEMYNGLLQRYEDLKARHKMLLETAEVLDNALREYQRKYDE